MPCNLAKSTIALMAIYPEVSGGNSLAARTRRRSTPTPRMTTKIYSAKLSIEQCLNFEHYSCSLFKPLICKILRYTIKLKSISRHKLIVNNGEKKKIANSYKSAINNDGWRFGGGGGGRGHFHYWILTVVGTCRWTGYDFPVITIDTGYLNRPNCLPAGYSVYHRVASQPSPQCRPAISAPATVRAGRNRFFLNVWWYTAE